MPAQDVTNFVHELKELRQRLPLQRQLMLDRVIVSALQAGTAGYAPPQPRREDQADDTAGYRFRFGRTEDEQAEHADDTAGYRFRAGRTENGQEQGAAAGDGEALWTDLAAWLSRDEDAEGFGIRRMRTETPPQDDTEGHMIRRN